MKASPCLSYAFIYVFYSKCGWMGISHPVSARGKVILSPLLNSYSLIRHLDQNSILDTFLPLFLLKCSVFLVIKALWKHRRSTYMPLTLASSSSSTHNPSYGSVPEHAAGAISVSSERTALQDDPLPKWTLYNMARITASILHIVIAGTALSQLASNDYDIDPVTEGPWTTLVMTTFGAHGLYWVRMIAMGEKVVEAYMHDYGSCIAL